MRATILSATIYSILASVATAGDASAAIDRTKDIPSQALAPALQRLVKERDIQLVYRAELIRDLHTNGASGDVEPIEALNQLLGGTGLTYRYLDDKTITIVPLIAGRPSDNESQFSKTPSGKETQKTRGFWDRFRLAQLDQGKAVEAGLAANSGGSAAQDNLSSVEEVIVTAQKRSERLIDVPVAVSVLSSEALMNRGVLQFEDYRASVPGLSSTPFAPGLNQFTIRGVTTGNSQRSATVATYFDEAPTNSNSSTAFGNRLTPDPDILDVAQIEVLRGPQGNLYGANALGGVIRYLFVQPELSGFHGRTQAGALSVEHGDVGYVARAALSGALVDGVLGARISGFSTEEPGFIDNTLTGRDNVNRSTNAGGRLAFLWKPTERFSASFSSLYQDRENDAYPYETYNRITGALSGDEYEQAFPTNDGSVGTEYQLHSLTLNVDFDFATLISATSYGRQKSAIVNDASAQLGSATQTQRATTLIDQRKFTQELRLASGAENFFEYTAGAFYTLEKVPARSFRTVASLQAPASSQVPIDILLDSRYEELSFFGNSTLHLADRFDLQVGGRWSYSDFEFSQTPIGTIFGPFNGSTFTGDSSLNEQTFAISPQFKLSPEANLYARVATGFRPGGANPATPAQFGPTPSTYEADSLINYEIGAKAAAFDRTLTLSTALYRIDWKDIHTTGIAGFFSYNFNGGKARSQGVEVEARWNSGGLNLDANVSFNDAETRDPIPAVGARAGDQLPYSPRWSGALNADYEFQLSGQTTATIGGGFRYTGERQAFFSLPVGVLPGALELDDYTVLDLRAGLQRGPYTVTAFVQNVTDEHAIVNVQTDYSNPATGVGATRGIMRPRTVGIMIGVDF